MENSAFDNEEDKHTTIELSEVKLHPSKPTNGHTCQPEVCRNLHEKFLSERGKLTGNPWDRLKTIFLIIIIALLILWIVTFAFLNKLNII